MKRNLSIPQFVLIVVFVCLALLQAEMSQTNTLHAQSDSQPRHWLPIMPVGLAGETDQTAENPTHQGIATFYDATGAGACLFDASPDDLMVAAINADEFDTAALCGAFVRVDGPDGTITVRIVDRCPECFAGHLDLSREAFALIAEPIRGRVPIRWQVISPQIEGPIAYHFKDGSNQWWTAVQIRNHRNPIAKVEYKADGSWIEVSRTEYNFFVQTDPGMGVGPYEFRVTDIYGNVLTDSNVPHIESGTINGNAQFPILGSTAAWLQPVPVP